MWKRWVLLTVLCLLSGSMWLAMPKIHAQTATTRIRINHLAPDSAPFDVYVDGKALFKGLAYSQVSVYAPVAVGSHTVALYPPTAKGKGTPLTSLTTANLAATTDHTYVAFGRVANLALRPFIDDNSAPAQGKARVRFTNASPDVSGVDLGLQGGTPLFTAIASGATGGYVSVDAGTYTVEITAAGTTLVSAPNVTFEAGKVYTAYLVGLRSGTGTQALKGALTRDAIYTQLPSTPITTIGRTPTVAPVTPTVSATATVGLASPTPTSTLSLTPTATTPLPGLPSTGQSPAQAENTNTLPFIFIFAAVSGGVFVCGFLIGGALILLQKSRR